MSFGSLELFVAAAGEVGSWSALVYRRCQNGRVSTPPPASAFGCASVIIGELVDLGVRDVVLAPGSRSAPLAYAAWDAERRHQVRLHVRIDERTGGFLALGLAKADERPVVVITTSGTAPSHLHPAVLEAAEAGVPLILITADRPASMIDTGANQTTRQVGLYGAAVRAEARLSDRETNPPGWRAAAQRLYTAAAGTRSRFPGPAHLNVEFSDPLTPDSPPVLNGTQTKLQRRPIRFAPAMSAPPTELAPGPLTVIVAGDAPVAVGRAAVALAATAQLPLLAEPSSNARWGPQAIANYTQLLGTQLGQRIERVICFGRPTISRPILRLLSRADVELIMVSTGPSWPDPGHAASQVVDAVSLPAADQQGSNWLHSWLQADRELAANPLLDREQAPNPARGRQLAATVWEALATINGWLVVGASQLIRDLDCAPVLDLAPKVFANRGLSGIDGTVSTAIGVALSAAANGIPVAALLGDLSFFHDLNGLLIGPREPRPQLRLIVGNDRGGAIFRQLEHGTIAAQGTRTDQERFARLFTTPHRTQLADLVAGFGHSYCMINNLDELPAHLRTPVTGIEVVEFPL